MYLLSDDSDDDNIAGASCDSDDEPFTLISKPAMDLEGSAAKPTEQNLELGPGTYRTTGHAEVNTTVQTGRGPYYGSKRT